MVVTLIVPHIFNVVSIYQCVFFYVLYTHVHPSKVVEIPVTNKIFRTTTASSVLRTASVICIEPIVFVKMVITNVLLIFQKLRLATVSLYEQVLILQISDIRKW